MKRLISIVFSIVLLLQCVPYLAAEEQQNAVATVSEQYVMRLYPTGNNAISAFESPYDPNGNFTLNGISSGATTFDGRSVMAYEKTADKITAVRLKDGATRTNYELNLFSYHKEFDSNGIPVSLYNSQYIIVDYYYDTTNRDAADPLGMDLSGKNMVFSTVSIFNNDESVYTHFRASATEGIVANKWAKAVIPLADVVSAPKYFSVENKNKYFLGQWKLYPFGVETGLQLYKGDVFYIKSIGFSCVDPAELPSEVIFTYGNRYFTRMWNADTALMLPELPDDAEVPEGYLFTGWRSAETGLIYRPGEVFGHNDANDASFIAVYDDIDALKPSVKGLYTEGKNVLSDLEPPYGPLPAGNYTLKGILTGVTEFDGHSVMSYQKTADTITAVRSKDGAVKADYELNLFSYNKEYDSNGTPVSLYDSRYVIVDYYYDTTNRDTSDPVGTELEGKKMGFSPYSIYINNNKVNYIVNNTSLESIAANRWARAVIPLAKDTLHPEYFSYETKDSYYLGQWKLFPFGNAKGLQLFKGDVFYIKSVEFSSFDPLRISAEATFTYKDLSFSQNHFIGEKFKLPSLPEDAVIPEGMVFNGWECGGKSYLPGSTFVIDSTEVNFTAKFVDKAALYLSEDGTIEGVTDTVYTSFDAAENAIAKLGGHGTIYISGDIKFNNATVQSKRITLVGYDDSASVTLCTTGGEALKGNDFVVELDDLKIIRASTSNDENFFSFVGGKLIIGKNCTFAQGTRTTTGAALDLYVGQAFSSTKGFDLVLNSPETRIAMLAPHGGWGNGGLSLYGDFNFVINDGIISSAYFASRNGKGESRPNSVYGNVSYEINGGNITKLNVGSHKTDNVYGNAVLTLNGGKIGALHYGNDAAYTNITDTVSQFDNVAIIYNIKSILDGGYTVPPLQRSGTPINTNNTVLIVNNAELASKVPYFDLADYNVNVMEGKATPVFIDNKVYFNIVSDDAEIPQPLVNGLALRANNDGLYTLEKGTTVITFGDSAITYFEGAQIRTEGTQGLRFIFGIREDIANGAVEFGSVVMPGKYLGDSPLEIGTTTEIDGKQYKAKRVPADKIFKKENGYIYYTVCITHIKQDNYSSEYVAVPYLITSENGEETTTYGDMTKNILVYSVAQKAIKDESCSESLKSYLEEKILSVATKTNFFVKGTSSRMLDSVTLPESTNGREFILGDRYDTDGNIISENEIIYTDSLPIESCDDDYFLSTLVLTSHNGKLLDIVSLLDKRLVHTKDITVHRSGDNMTGYIDFDGTGAYLDSSIISDDTDVTGSVKFINKVTEGNGSTTYNIDSLSFDGEFASNSVNATNMFSAKYPRIYNGERYGAEIYDSNGDGYADYICLTDDFYVLTGSRAKDYVVSLYEQGLTLSDEAILEGIEVVSEQMKQDIINTPNTQEIYGDKMNGQIYYISEKNGNDSNDGKSPENAFKTINGFKAKIKDLATGSSVLFERGGVYRGTLSTSRNGVIYGSYGNGKKPIIMQSQRNFADESLWTPVDGYPNVWLCTEKLVNVGVMAFDHDIWDYSASTYDETYGYIMNKNLFNFDGIHELTSDLQFYSELPNNSTSTAGNLYLYSTEGNPGKRFASIEIGENITIMSGSGNDVVIDNISFKYTGAHGMGGAGGCKNRTVTNCIYSWLGGSILSVDFHGNGRPVNYGNAVEIYGSCNGYVVQNCWIYQIYDTAVTHQFSNATKCVQTGVRYLENLIEYCFWGIEFYNGNDGGVLPPEQKYTSDVISRYNVLNKTGYGWGSIVRFRDGYLYNGSSLSSNYDCYTEYNVFNTCSGDIILLVANSNEIPDKNIYVQYLGNRLGTLKGVKKICDIHSEEYIKNYYGDKNPIVIVLDPVK